MDLLVVTSVRLLAESLEPCLVGHGGIKHVRVAYDMDQAVEHLKASPLSLVLIDVSAGIDKQRMRSLALNWPNVRFLALGIEEHSDTVISCGRMGFAGYVPRDAGLNALRRAVLDCGADRLTCSAEMTSHLMRALLSPANEPECEPRTDGSLTDRESDVRRLLSRGLSNKEIARELGLSVATIKHHVHNVLGKLNVTRRVQVVAQQRGA